MKPLARYTKDPSAELPYSIDWSAWLPDGETIDTAVWAVDSPAAATLNASSSIVVGAVATALLTDGDPGTAYVVRCRVTTTPSAYVDDRSIVVTVEER